MGITSCPNSLKITSEKEKQIIMVHDDQTSLNSDQSIVMMDHRQT